MSHTQNPKYQFPKNKKANILRKHDENLTGITNDNVLEKVSVRHRS